MVQNFTEITSFSFVSPNKVPCGFEIDNHKEEFPENVDTAKKKQKNSTRTQTPTPLLTCGAHWECFRPLEAVAAVTLRLWWETLSLIQHEAVCDRCSLHSVYFQPTGKKTFNLHNHALPQ